MHGGALRGEQPRVQEQREHDHEGELADEVADGRRGVEAGDAQEEDRGGVDRPVEGLKTEDRGRDDAVVRHRLEGDRRHALAYRDDGDREDREGAPAGEPPEDGGAELRGVLPGEQPDAGQDRDGAHETEDEPPAAPGGRGDESAGAPGGALRARTRGRGG